VYRDGFCYDGNEEKENTMCKRRDSAPDFSSLTTSGLGPDAWVVCGTCDRFHQDHPHPLNAATPEQLQASATCGRGDGEYAGQRVAVDQPAPPCWLPSPFLIDSRTREPRSSNLVSRIAELAEASSARPTEQPEPLETAELEASGQLRTFLGDQVIEIVTTASNVNVYDVVFEDGEDTRELCGWLVGKKRALSGHAHDAFRVAVLDPATFVWDHVTRHMDMPSRAFEVTSPTGTCVFFFDENGAKIRFCHDDTSRVRDCCKASKGFQQLRELPGVGSNEEGQ